MRKRLGLGFGSISLITLTACGLVYGCSSDDSNGGGDDTSDSGPSADATTLDGTTPFDSGSKDSGPSGDGSVLDSGFDAGPPAHVVFLTSTGFTGDFVGQATALATDAGTDAGLDGGAEQYLPASDVLCQATAAKAGLKGTFAAIIRGGTDVAPFARFTDADGPWALVDGTPVADSAKDLADGRWRHSIDKTETGTELAYDESKYAWGSGGTGQDCNGWTSASSALSGYVGSYSLTSGFALANTQVTCNVATPLYCAQVGPGGGTNRYASVPAGGKRVFFVDRDLPTNFSALASTFVDASIPDAGDPLHSNADEICNEAARAAGTTGKYHAWVASAAVGATAYFTSHSMNGPWYRADGAEIAASLADLTTLGTRTQVETTPDGKLVPNLQNIILTGTYIDGGVDTNCADFTSLGAGVFGTGGRPGYASVEWSNRNGFQCSNGTTGGLACFEE